MTTPIIFLDLDGVLNHEEWYTSKEFASVDKDGEWKYYCTWSVKLLNKLTDVTGAKIVFTSSHRVDYDSIEELQDWFDVVGITGKVIGITPKLFYSNNNYSVPRGCEIKAWLEQNKQRLGAGIGKYRNYVIFDDDTDMLYWQRRNFIPINTTTGLTLGNIEHAMKILKYKKNVT